MSCQSDHRVHECFKNRKRRLKTSKVTGSDIFLMWKEEKKKKKMWYLRTNWVIRDNFNKYSDNDTFSGVEVLKKGGKGGDRRCVN